MDMEDKSKLMDYLYNEMSPEEIVEFEKELASSPELREELEEMRHTLGMLGEYQEEEKIAPVFLLPERKKSSGIWWKTGLSVAASLVLVLFLAAFAGMQLQMKGDTWVLSFSKNPPPPATNFQEMSALEQRLRALETQQSYANSTTKETVNLNKDTLEQIIHALQKTQNEQLQLALKGVRAEQQEDLQTAILTLFELLDQRRQEDLVLIARSLQEVQDNSEELFFQTDELLGQIIMAMNTQNSK